MTAIRLDPALFEGGRTPIVHPDRTIGDTAELVPGAARGEPGPLKEIIRTRGGDDHAQLLTVTIVGSGVYGSSLAGNASGPRGPIVGVVEWGVRGAKARVELDVPQGGVTFSLVASYLHVAARYDGMLVVDGAQLDPEAQGGATPGPVQRVGAMVGYGSYGAASRVTRTVRLNSLGAPDGGPTVGPPIRVPNFARRVLVGGAGIDRNGYEVRFGGFSSEGPSGGMAGPLGRGPMSIDLPGDATYVQLANEGPRTLDKPVLVFEIGL